MKKMVAALLAMAMFLACVPFALANWGEGIVICTSLTVREEPREKAAQIGDKATKGTALRLIDDAYGDSYYWYEVPWVDKNGKAVTGWVRADFIVENPRVVYPRSSETLIYSAPSRGAKCIAELNTGSGLMVIGEYNGFYNVYIVSRGECGFVLMNQVR